MVLPVKVYTPFSRTETEGVRVGERGEEEEEEEEEEGMAVDGAMLEESVGSGRSGNRALERVVVEKSGMAVATPAVEEAGGGEVSDSEEEVERRSAASEPEPEKLSGGGEDEMVEEEEVEGKVGLVEKPREGVRVSRESGSMASWEEEEGDEAVEEEEEEYEAEEAEGDEAEDEEWE